MRDVNLNLARPYPDWRRLDDRDQGLIRKFSGAWRPFWSVFIRKIGGFKANFGQFLSGSWGGPCRDCRGSCNKEMWRRRKIEVK